MSDPVLPPDRDWTRGPLLSRRATVAGTATLGFAAACHPIASTAMNTSSEGIITDSATVKGADGFSVPLFFARPEGNKPAPVIIVVHEIFGVHEWIKDMCRRFAKAGYYAVAPDLYARAGDATKVADFNTLISTIVAKTPDDQVLSDIDKAVAWAGAHGGKIDHLGITGFCWGGRIVWLYSGHSPALKAGVAFYGRLTGDTGTQAITLANKLHGPVLGQYGGLDRGIPQTDVNAMNAALKQAGSPSHITVYPQAEHGFMADYRSSYNADAAKTAWAAALDWFGKYLR